MYNPTRLHPLAAWLTFLKLLKEWLIPLIIFMFFGPGNPPGMEWLSYAPFLFVITLGGFAVLQWYRFTYYIQGEELRIEYGVFVRKKRYIPKKRIQSIDYTQGIFHRIFNVVKLNIETAGGPGGAEASLSAIGQSDAKKLGSILREAGDISDHTVDDTDTESSLVTYKMSTKDLILAASTSGGIGLALPFVGTIGSQLDNLIPEDFYVEAFNWLSGFSWVVITMLVFLSVFFAWFLSFLGVILKYANFRIQRFEDRIVISRGLFEKRELTFPIQRIQGLRIVESVLRQPFGFATVHVESAGGAGPEMGESAMLFPFIKRSKINEELAGVLPGYKVPAQMVPLPRRAIMRYILRNIAPSLLVIPLFWLIPSSFWVFLFIPVIAFSIWGVLDYRDSKWLVDENSFYLQTRTLSKTLLITERRRMQDFELKQSFFQKRHELYTFKTAILSGGVGKVFQLKDVDQPSGKDVYNWFTSNYKHYKLK